MKFHPRPYNEFPEFIQTYFERCRAACPRILACAGKWRPEDLIPGLSDFDTRFIVSNDTTTEDWLQMSLIVGHIHTELAKEKPGWARILEHLPGVNLSLSEMLDPIFYFPEFQQWTFYHGNPQVIQTVQAHLGQKHWDRRDQLFHLKKFATYVGPYHRGIDPAINLGAYENKYPLHSRLMHYFAPPVQSAVSLLHRHNYCGKLEALRVARAVLPNPEVIDFVLETIERHYEVGPPYQEPKLSQLERILEKYLQSAYAMLEGKVDLIKIDSEDSSHQIRAKVASVPVDSAQLFFEGIRYCRFMKGRLLFYAKSIPWFETAWLIRNELGRMIPYFFTQPLMAYALVRYEKPTQVSGVLDDLSEDILTPQECEGMKEFLRVASWQVSEGGEKQQAQRVADVLDSVLVCLEKLKTDLRCRIQSQVPR
jgi:hypothetical protein